MLGRALKLLGVGRGVGIEWGMETAFFFPYHLALKLVNARLSVNVLGYGSFKSKLNMQSFLNLSFQHSLKLSVA